MKDKKTPFILRPVMVGLFLVAALAVCALAYRASEKAEIVSESAAHDSEMARLQESRAYYEGRISAEPPVIEEGEVALPAMPEVPEEIQTTPKDLIVPEYSEIVPPAEPEWQKNPATFKPDGSKPKIVIIIDDMGMDRKRTKEALALTAPVTFAWLPYATNIQPLVDEAKAAGHESLVHIPMEPESASIDAGPTVLKTSMSSEQMKAMIDTNLSAFTGYVGFNNHMGSKMTQDANAMQQVMAEAAKRRILFVDSRTSQNSVADQTAAAMGVPHAMRDVFLDHFEDIHSVRAALEKMEQTAKKQGYAIGIGHPKDNTLAALKEWVPTLAAKGFELAPVSAVVRTSEPAAGETKMRVSAVAISSPFVVGPLQPLESARAPY